MCSYASSFSGETKHWLGQYQQHHSASIFGSVVTTLILQCIFITASPIKINRILDSLDGRGI